MNTLDKILDELNKTSHTQKELCEALGIGKQAFSDWKSGKSTSYIKYLPKIADYFGVSVDYLLGKTEQKEKPTVQDDGLEDEKTKIFRELIEQLPPEGLVQVEQYLRFLLSQNGSSETPQK